MHIDAHLDWRDSVNGVKEGLSSPMRRASEMPHVARIVQIGLRAQGSGRPEDLAAARAYGADLITAYELHDIGMDAVLARIPMAAITTSPSTRMGWTPRPCRRSRAPRPAA